MPDRPEDPDGRPGSTPEESAALDAAWDEIVANYGDHPAIEDEPAPPPSGRTAPAVEEEPADAWEPEDHYSPPEPPPAPRPRGLRGLAWVAMLGSPVVTLALLLAQVHPPGWASLLLFLAFVGGLGYLIATMPRGDDDDPFFGDDGAVV